MSIFPFWCKFTWLLDFRERSLMYQFKAISIPGNANGGKWYVSYPRAYHQSSSRWIGRSRRGGANWNRIPVKPRNIPIKMAWIQQEAKVDYQYLSFVETIEKGFPEYKEHLPVHIREFWNMQNNLCTVQSLVFKEGCVLIPRKLCCELLDQLHIGHQEVNSMRSNTRQRFFWPGMAT